MNNFHDPRNMDKKTLTKEKKKLNEVIKKWNESRVDLFEISKPNEKLEFHGVMRFYHQDGSNGKYATKCIRVGNRDKTNDVIEMLSSKFRPDMRMLTTPKYALYEVHEDTEMRKLDSDQYPLLVQLNWGKEDLEGRFLLHNEDTKQPPRINDGFYDDREAERTSKHDKKKKKPEKKQKNKKKDPHQEISAPQISEPMTAAQELYTQVPESTFTRTVSNPEAVMKKRREQKLQKKGAETLKIYGDRINPEHPYKSLLLLPGDKVPTVIQDTLNKYGLGKEKVEDYSIIKVVLPPNSKPEDSLQGGWGIETYLTDDECPLAISQDWQPHKGTLVFQLRHKSNVKKGQSKPSKQAPQNREKKRSETEPTDDPRPPDRKKHKTPPKKLPQEAMHPPKTKQPHAALVPMSPGPTEADMMGGDIIKSSDPVPKILEFSSLFDDYNVHVVSPSITEIGSDRNAATYGPFIEVENKTGVLPLHCVLANMDGVVTVTPHEGKNVEVFVDGHRIEETRMLNHSSVIWLGRKTHLVYCKPNGEIVVPYVVRQIKATNPNRKVLNDFTNQRRNAGQQQNYGKSKTLPLNAEPPQSDDNYIISKQQQGQHAQSTNDLYGQQPSQNHRPQQNGRGPVPGLNDRHHSISTHSHSLPCLLRINKELGEESFVSEIVNVNGTSLHFKLSPAYTIYLSLRDIVENAPKHLLDSSIDEYLCLVTDLLDQTIQMNKSAASELAFWMANSSELLNFIRQDQDLSHLTTHMQDVLAKIVQLSFRHLVQCMQIELYEYMSAFLSYSDDDIPGGERKGEHRRSAPGEDPNMYDILHMLSSAMSLLRRCRVNAALTIQLFSQLFHFINMWIFNEVACKPEQRLCCRVWGIKIRTRLARVEAWAEKQGLELAADCHLARVTQAMHLLQAPKQSADDIAAISGTCFKLNSLQLRALLSNYEPSYEDGETEIANELIDNVVSVAENTADELIRSDGREICLEEDPDLQLPFLLPEDGYSCDVVRSIPSGLREFLKNLQREELCTYTVIADAPGSWTVHFAVNSARESAGSDVSAPASHVSSHTGQPEIATVVLNKRGGGMGLSIVAAKGMGQEKSGIYIRSVVKGGAAYHDRRLQAGDQLLSVDGHSLVGVSQERAADLMTKTGQRVTLTVAKQGAVFHRLATLLSQATPPQQRAANPQRRPHATTTNQPRPKSDGYALSQSQDSNDPYWKAGENAQPVPAKSTQNISYNSNENNSRTTGYSRNEPDPVSHSKYPIEPCSKVNQSMEIATTEPQKSPSAVSVTSDSTSDSGFISVTPVNGNNILNRSYNSAFAPLKREMVEDKTIPVSTSNNKTIISYKDAQLVSKFLTNSGPPKQDVAPTCDNHANEKVISPRSDVSNNSDAAQFLTRAQRRQQRLARRMELMENRFKSEDKIPAQNVDSPKIEDNTKEGIVDKEAEASRLRKLHREQMRAEKETRKKKSDTDDFVMQRSRREARALARSNKGRVRSLSASRSESFSEQRNYKPAQPPMLRRSNSFVDMQKIIKEAESRDRHARVEEARLEGLIPPRRYLGAKEPIRISKSVPAHETIHKFQQHQDTVFTRDNFPKRSNSFGQGSGTYSRPTSARTPGIHNRHYTAPSRSHSVTHENTPAPVPQGVVSYTPRYREYKRRSTDSDEERREKYKPRPLNHSTQPRPAQSMSDLKSPIYPASKAKESDRNLTWQQKRAQNAYQHQRMKAQSQTTLPTSNDFSRNNKETDAQWRRKEVQNLITQKSPRSPKDMYYETSHSPHHHTNKFAVDNPNYELLPPPPSPPPESIQSPHSTPRDEPSHPPPPVDLPPAPQGRDMPDHSMKYNSSKTIDRPSSGRKEESRKPKAIQKSSAATKSSTLPRHFKSQSNWEKGSQDNYIQEQLNALRDDEIEELSSKFDSLTAFEKDRLDKLLNERDFQRRVQEDSRRYISDEEDDDEFIVPDRPDRDLLLQMKAKTDADTPQAENEERKRKQEEERYRKEKEEEERREKEERERIIRERLEQEREDRKREEDEKKNHDKYERVEAERRQKEKIFQEMQRREEEQWQKEQEELRRKEEEEERRRERERQEYEHEMRLRELQRKREEEENAIREIRAQREAQERVLRLEREQKRRRERSRHHAPSNDDDDERERELLEKKLSEGKPSNFTRFSSSSAPRYASQSTQGYAPMSATGYRKPSTNTYVHSAQRAYQPPMREGPKNSTRPVSDGYMLRNNDVFNHDNESPPRSANDVQTTPTNRPISYIASDKTPGVIGAQERYKDPRDKREATLKREQNSRRRQPDPSQMTFKDRQKLFTSGQTPTEKPRASKKLLEIQHSLM